MAYFQFYNMPFYRHVALDWLLPIVGDEVCVDKHVSQWLTFDLIESNAEVLQIGIILYRELRVEKWQQWCSVHCINMIKLNLNEKLQELI